MVTMSLRQFARRKSIAQPRPYRDCRRFVPCSLPDSVHEGEGGGIVIEGRDIGSVVFPNADVKIYLDAAPEERARRRAADPAHGMSRTAATEDVAMEMEARDTSDKTRSTSPLTVAADAVEIDTTGLSVDEVVERVMDDSGIVKSEI